VDALRAVRKQERTEETITVSAADPLNVVGIVLPGPRVPALRTNTVTYVDGVLGSGRPAGGCETLSTFPRLNGLAAAGS
jgi:hypothetical protein